MPGRPNAASRTIKSNLPVEDENDRGETRARTDGAAGHDLGLLTQEWAMFEIGEDYTVTMIVGDPSGWTTQEGVWKVVEINGTLIKLQNPHSTDLIVNTASWHFVSAALV
jgi:hypothetical protein